MMKEPRESHMKDVRQLVGIWSLLLFISFTVQPVVAQEGRTYSNPEGWQRVSTENFDVYYFGENESGARKTAKFAELARFEIGTIYDYKPEEKYSLIYLPGSDAFLQTNLDWKTSETETGVFTLPKRSGPVIDFGTSKQLFEEVKYQVAQQIFKEFAYGDRLGGAIQNQLLLYNPQWFYEGLAEYISSNWDFQDEIWLNSVRNGDELLELALEGDDHINRVVRKSIWHFIAHEYGEPKISEIIYLVNIAHSIESGLISVLGITLNTLTERWRDFVLSRKKLGRAGRSEIEQMPGLEKISIKHGYELTSFAYNEVEGIIAMYLHKRGLHRLYIYDISSESYIYTGVHSGATSERAQYLDFYYPMAWSPEGDILATTVYNNHKYELAYYNLSNKNAITQSLPKAIQSIHSLAWSHDGAQLALSAYGNGQSDIYVTPTNNPKFTAITNDRFDDIYPNWSLDDKKIFFSSNRSEASLDETPNVLRAYKKHFDVFAFDYEVEGDSLQRITNTPSFNEFQVMPWSSFEVGYISDASGIQNLNRANIFLGQEEPLSNFSFGIQHLDVKDRSMVISTLSGEEQMLYVMDKDNFTVVRNPEPTMLRIEYDANYRKKLNEDKKEEEEEIAAISREEQTLRPIPGNEDEVDNDDESDSEVEEEKNSADQPVRYYLFDEEDEPYEVKAPQGTVFRPQPTTIQTQSLFNSVFMGEERPNLAEVDVSAAVRAKSSWTADYFMFGIKFDPIARYGLDVGVGFSDMLGNHNVQVRLSPFLRVRNRDANIRYNFAKYRVDFFAEGNITSRLFEQESAVATLDTLDFQFDRYDVKVGAEYPLLDRLVVGGEIGYNRISRKDLKLIRNELFDANDNVIKPGVYVRYSNVKEREGYKYFGLSAQANFDSYYSMEVSDFAFHTARVNVKGYYTLFNKIVLAAQVVSGVSFADTISERQQFYLGGIENILRGFEFEESNENTLEFSDVSSDLYNFSFQRFLTPSRGFDFFARNGSRYVLSNLEMRIPISRLVKHSLNSNPLYSMEFIPFVDVGVVWDEGNPFSSKKPTDTQIIGSNPVIVQLRTLKSPFLFGFGSGIRTNLIGYSIRLDLAWGLDDNTLQAPIFSVSLGRNF